MKSRNSESIIRQRKAHNSLPFQISEHGWQDGFLIWYWNTIYRGLSMTGLVLTRIGVGRSSFGLISTVNAFFCMTLLSMLDFSAAGQEQMNLFFQCFHAIPEAIRCFKNPKLFANQNVPLLVFNVVITGLALANKVHEQLTLKKPNSLGRGDSRIIMSLDLYTSSPERTLYPVVQTAAEAIRRAGNQWDIKGVFQRFVEPMIIAGVGIVFWKLSVLGIASADFYPISVILIFSGVCYFHQEMRSFNYGRMVR